LQIGNTALMYAAHGDHPHCTNELLLRGSDVTMINLSGDSAFGIAIKKGSKLGTVLFIALRLVDKRSVRACLRGYP
jgi:ankyrin repeat protein